MASERRGRYGFSNQSWPGSPRRSRCLVSMVSTSSPEVHFLSPAVNTFRAILLLLALILRSAWALPHNPYGSHSNALSTTGQLSQNESRVGAVAVTLVLATGLAHYVVVIAAFAKFLSCETNAEFEIHGQTAATTTDEEMELGRTGRDVQEVTLNPL
ncbi:hypothetical protein AcV7_001584 [Taiwanofungus camphoratus]|nr:hypothetical protein AcV7_001584 [Antrodia cinnamomea]